MWISLCDDNRNLLVITRNYDSGSGDARDEAVGARIRLSCTLSHALSTAKSRVTVKIDGSVARERAVRGGSQSGSQIRSMVSSVASC